MTLSSVRRLAAEQAAQVSFEATVQAAAQQTGKRQVEELVQRSAVDFDAFYAQQ